MLKKISYHKIIYPLNLLIILFLNLIFINLPLSNILGYEFSALNALLLSIISGLYSISLLKSNQSNFKVLVYKLIFFLLLPLIISVIHSFFTMFCSFTDGLMFYFLITLPSVFVGVGLGIISIIIVKKFRKTFFILMVIFLALIPVLEIYFFPQVYFYSPLIGYFPGNIYDEGLSPDWQLVLHQILILAYFLLIIYSFIKWESKLLKFKNRFAIIILLIFIVFEFVSSYLGFTTTFTRLDNYLPNKITTENTVLHFDALTKQDADFIALNQQYYFERISDILKVKINKKVNVYLFNSRAQKKELFGAGNADVAKPWQFAVFISKDSWESTLKHELVHVFSAEFGTGIFKLASGFNASMIEGLAEAIDNNFDNYTVSDLAVLAFQNDYKIDLRNLFEGLNFFKQNSSLSYTYSGAFFKFLIDKYGIEKVKDFYSSGDFKYSFNTDINSLKSRFESSLKSKSEFGNKNMADYYFGRLSIVQKVCPRYVSDRVQKAWKYFFGSDVKSAKSIFIEINKKVTNYSALIGLSEIYFKEGKIQSAINLINQNLNKLRNSPYYFEIQLKLADFYAQNEDPDSASIIYRKIIDENANYHLTSLAKVRIALQSTQKIKSYFSGDDSIKYNLLAELNRKKYFYDSFDLLLQLAKAIKIDYKYLQNIFDKTFIIDDVISSYAVFKLSEYLLEIGNYTGGRKMAALSLRFKDGNPFLNTLFENYDKVNWFYYNANKKMKTFYYVMNKKKEADEIK